MVLVDEKFKKTPGLTKEFVDDYYKAGGTGAYKEGNPTAGYYENNVAKMIYKRIFIRRKKNKMFINKITIKNFRLFPSASDFVIDDINTPDGTNEGSGLNVFVGENGSGKTALLDAFAFPILEYKTENFGIENFNDTNKKIEINIYSKQEFEVDGTMPKSSFKAKGFSFEAGVRSRGTKTYLSSIVVNDQKFIKVDPLKPADSSPDLRVNVNNPFKGKRFSENDVLF